MSITINYQLSPTTIEELKESPDLTWYTTPDDGAEHLAIKVHSTVLEFESPEALGDAIFLARHTGYAFWEDAIADHWDPVIEELDLRLRRALNSPIPEDGLYTLLDELNAWRLLRFGLAHKEVTFTTSSIFLVWFSP